MLGDPDADCCRSRVQTRQMLQAVSCMSRHVNALSLAQNLADYELSFSALKVHLGLARCRCNVDSVHTLGAKRET